MSWFARKFNSLAWRIVPLVPKCFQLRFIHLIQSLCSDQETEVSFLKQIGPCRGVAIDVGANYGMYSLPLSKLYAEVVAFEPNIKVAEPLAWAQLSNVRIVNEGLSASEGEAVLHIPVSKGVLLVGWASLDDKNCSEATSLQSLPIVIRALDHHHITDVGFMKIDVEGHEVQVLRGAEQTIRRDLPHLLIEVRGKHNEEVRTLLAGWGYVETSLRSLAGHCGSPGNLIFVPRG